MRTELIDVDYCRRGTCGTRTADLLLEAILQQHDAATGQRRFNALLATASINDAIEYHALFKTMQAERKAADPDFQPLNIACVFSPPAEGDPDVKQIQEACRRRRKTTSSREVEPWKISRTTTSYQTTRSASSK